MMWAYNAVISANSRPQTANREPQTASRERRTANRERRTFCCDPACPYPSAVVAGHPKGRWQKPSEKEKFTTGPTACKPDPSRTKKPLTHLVHKHPHQP